MIEWDHRSFQEHLGFKTNWGIISGRALSGKTTVAQNICNLSHGKILNMHAIAETCKGRLGTEDEPFEGEVPLEEIQKDTLAIVAKDKAACEKFTYVFDGYAHKSPADFVAWANESFGPGDFYVNCTSELKDIEERYKKKNEVEEVGEDVAEELAAQEKEANLEAKALTNSVTSLFGARCQQLTVANDSSLEALFSQLRSMFCAKVVLVNHEQRLNVDTACSNIAICFNMLYLSVHQLIKQHITKGTKMGKELLASKKLKQLVQESGADEFEECEYSAAHFDMHLVAQLIK